MEWVGSNKDILSLLIALLAVMVSLSTVLIGFRNLRTNSFMSIQNRMLSNEMQRGRLLVYRAIATGEAPARDSDEEYLMVRSLAVFDELGMLARLRIVPREWVLRFWHARLHLMTHGFGMEFDPARPYILQGRPNLQYLIACAGRYRCDQDCCADGQKELRLREPQRARTAPATTGIRAGIQHRRRPLLLVRDLGGPMRRPGSRRTRQRNAAPAGRAARAPDPAVAREIDRW
ncbi:MAG TPA: hypothetical protein VFW27_30415 [Actinoplanes sp.]|nr:hypothetical protein [Actinoplanes sp.]